MSVELDVTKRCLHLGCGRTILPGYVNLDAVALPGVDVVADLDDCAKTPLPFESDTFDEILGSHVIEHIRDPLPLMAELHRVSKSNATAVFRTPYGSSDDAHEDPTHVRQYFVQSWGYFSQPFYWRADYGYRGDWQPERLTLKVRKSQHEGKSAQEILGEINRLRNVVLEMVASLRCVKPIREARRDLQVAPRIDISLV